MLAILAAVAATLAAASAPGSVAAAVIFSAQMQSGPGRVTSNFEDKLVAAICEVLQRRFLESIACKSLSTFHPIRAVHDHGTAYVPSWHLFVGVEVGRTRTMMMARLRSHSHMLSLNEPGMVIFAADDITPTPPARPPAWFPQVPDKKAANMYAREIRSPAFAAQISESMQLERSETLLFSRPSIKAVDEPVAHPSRVEEVAAATTTAAPAIVRRKKDLWPSDSHSRAHSHSQKKNNQKNKSINLDPPPPPPSVLFSPARGGAGSTAGSTGGSSVSPALPALVLDLKALLRILGPAAFLVAGLSAACAKVGKLRARRQTAAARKLESGRLRKMRSLSAAELGQTEGGGLLWEPPPPSRSSRVTSYSPSRSTGSRPQGLPLPPSPVAPPAPCEQQPGGRGQGGRGLEPQGLPPSVPLMQPDYTGNDPWEGEYSSEANSDQQAAAVTIIDEV